MKIDQMNLNAKVVFYTSLCCKLYVNKLIKVDQINREYFYVDSNFERLLSKNGILIELVEEHERTLRLYSIAYGQNREMIKYVPHYLRLFV